MADDSLWGRVDAAQFAYTVVLPPLPFNGDDTRESTDRTVVLTAVQGREICDGTPAFPSHGHCVWDAALLLADYLQTRAALEPTDSRRLDFRGKKAVELGAGVGLVGMTLAVLGADVVLTDQQYTLPLLERNVQVNFRGNGAVHGAAPRVEECQWGEALQQDGDLQQWAAEKSVDVVAFSDVLYHPEASLLLIQTLLDLTSSETDVFFSFETRSAEIEDGFLDALGIHFNIATVSSLEYKAIFAKLDYPDELFVYHAKRKATVA